MLKPNKQSSSCVRRFFSRLNYLKEVGNQLNLQFNRKLTQDDMRELLLPVTDDDRIQKIIVKTGGTQEIPEIITIDTISKFAPYDDPTGRSILWNYWCL